MKLRRVIEVTTSTEAEQQFILARFPEALWFTLDDTVRFYINESKVMEIEDAVNDFERSNNES